MLFRPAPALVADQVSRRLADLDLLRPGEHVDSVVPAYRGVSPYAYVLRWLVLFSTHYLIVATNQSVFLMQGRRPLHVSSGKIRRLPRDSSVGSPSQSWFRLGIGGVELWVKV